MKTFFFCLCLIAASVVGHYAQSATPRPIAMPQPTPNQVEIIREQQARNQRFEMLRNISDGRMGNNRFPSTSSAAERSIEMLYRKTNERELKVLAPDKEDLAKFADFLRQPNTGLIKLAADKNCAENPNVVVATADCLAYTMPGAGSSYSFRVRDYRIARLADLTFTENSFQATGIRLHGIFVEIGDVPLDEVNLQTKGMRYLVNFRPEADFQKAKELDRLLSEGVRENGFLYRRALRARDNTTYVLRSIAYQGKYMRTFQGKTYNELGFDKRKDVIVAFRIVRRNDDGAITILWKQMAEQNSPKTKSGK